MTDAWLVGVGGGGQQLEEHWLERHPELLRKWPSGPQQRSGIKRGDLLVYYAAGHQKLIAVVRASQDGKNATDEALPVQPKLAIPFIPFAPSYKVLGLPSDAITGMRARRLEDSEYEQARIALLAVADLA